MKAERRQYTRAATEVIVQFFEDSPEKNEQSIHSEGIVENFSAGGMYISTEHPPSRGSSVILKFRIKANPKALLPIQVRAVVRWVRQVTNPKGMGVEFVEFEGIDERDFEEWLSSLLG